jgi:metal-responsive CopG/Arc/MetJ family transcriptional regulator
MKTKTISFRCPEEILDEMDALCNFNRVDRSTFIVQALHKLLTGLETQGVSLPQAPLPADSEQEDK